MMCLETAGVGGRGGQVDRYPLCAKGQGGPGWAESTRAQGDPERRSSAASTVLTGAGHQGTIDGTHWG